MIWIDFVIICIGQEKKSVPPNMDNLVIEAYKRTDNAEPFYNEHYDFKAANKQAFGIIFGCPNQLALTNLFLIYLPSKILMWV